MHFGSDFKVTMFLLDLTRNIFSLFTMNRYEALAISTVTAASLLGLRQFFKQHSVLMSAMIVGAALFLSQYRMHALSAVKGVLTLSKFEVSLMVAGAVVAYYAIQKFIGNVQHQWLQRKLKKFNNTPKDLVTLHGFPRPKTMPASSPFVLKVETFLRMGHIKYEYESTEPFGPYGKAPWISLNGEHISDSELIIEHLVTKFGKDLHHRYTDQELAIAKCARRTLEEHAVWGLSLEKYVFENKHLMDFSSRIPFFANFYMKWVLKSRAKAQGMGILTQDEVVMLVNDDIRSVSYILGDNDYIVGKHPCLHDCGIFAVLATIQWGTPESRFKGLLDSECSNLKDYCLRMKDRFFPDWDQLLGQN